MIVVVDYGAGNVRSVSNALARLGAEFCVSASSDDIKEADALILPGVGHFSQLCQSLDRLEIRRTLLAALASGTPYLGICLGMQVLFEGSDEAVTESGLSILEGRVTKISGGQRVPHMGWNLVQPTRTSEVLKDPDYFYFAHTYAVNSTATCSASCSYGREIVAAVERDNIFGVQFHPEKSGQAGAKVLRSFIEVSRC